MRERLHALQRMTAAVSAKKRSLDMHVVVLNQRIDALGIAEHSTMEALSQPSGLHGGMTEHYVKRLETLKRERARLIRELQGLKLQSLECKRDVKRCELLEERERQALSRKEETGNLEGAIDFFLLRQLRG
jgi:hypothetical protein